MTTAIIETLELFEVTVSSLLIMIMRLDSAVSGFFIRYNVFHAAFRNAGQHGFTKKGDGLKWHAFHNTRYIRGVGYQILSLHQKIEITHFSLCSKLGSLMEK